MKYLLLILSVPLFLACTNEASQTLPAPSQEETVAVQPSDDTPKETVVCFVDQGDYDGYEGVKKAINDVTSAEASEDNVELITIDYQTLKMAEIPPEIDRCDAFILSPQGTPWGDSIYGSEYFTGLKEVLLTTKKPTLGICGGHQSLAIAFGAEVCNIGENGEINPNCQEGTPKTTAVSDQYLSTEYLGAIHESGDCEISLTNTDPLFSGLSESEMMRENHREEVKNTLALNENFLVIASGKSQSSNCYSQVQGIKHKSYPFYGVQFHPETSDDAGYTIIRNFLNIAKAS